MHPYAMGMDLGVQQARAEGQYVQPAWAVSTYGTWHDKIW